MKNIVLYLISLIIFNSFGATNGFSSKQDKRIKSAVYSDDQVYNIYTKIGEITLIQLQDDEIIIKDKEGAAVFAGNKNSYDKPQIFKNKIIFKPIKNNIITNFIIVTDKRNYIFNIKPANKKNPVTYVLTFNQNADLENYFYKKNGKENYNYYGKGDKELSPLLVYDDGLFTYFDFSNIKNKPTIFKMDESKNESSISTHIKNQIMVVHEVAKNFYIRKDKKVLSIINKGFVNAN